MSQTPNRTFKLDRLYHRFLKPKRISIDRLPLLATKLYEQGFIEIFRDPRDPDLERYLETDKLISGEHKNELFKLIGSL